MICQSLEEYKEICAQVREASGDVLKYASSAAAISGAFFVAIISGSRILEKPDLGVLAIFLPVLLLIVCNITLYIQSLVIYKCKSHNRLAAYRNLIAVEVLSNTKTVKGSEKDAILAVSFDYCMDHLNRTLSSKAFYFGSVNLGSTLRSDSHDQLSIGASERDQYVKQLVVRSFSRNISFPDFPYSDQLDRDENRVDKSFMGIGRCAKLLLSQKNTEGSWLFPAYVNSMFFFVIFVEFVASAISLWFSAKNLYSLISSHSDAISYLVTLLILYLVLLFFGLVLLKRASAAIQALLVGESRISTYFMQFLTFRYKYICSIYGDVDPYYIGSQDMSLR